MPASSPGVTPASEGPVVVPPSSAQPAGSPGAPHSVHPPATHEGLPSATHGHTSDESGPVTSRMLAAAVWFTGVLPQSQLLGQTSPLRTTVQSVSLAHARSASVTFTSTHPGLLDELDAPPSPSPRDPSPPPFVVPVRTVLPPHAAATSAAASTSDRERGVSGVRRFMRASKAYRARPVRASLVTRHTPRFDASGTRRPDATGLHALTIARAPAAHPVGACMGWHRTRRARNGTVSLP